MKSKAEQAAYQKAWREAHREEVRAYHRDWQERNRDHVSAKNRQRYAGQRDTILTRAKAADPKALYKRHRAARMRRLSDPQYKNKDRAYHREYLRDWRRRNKELEMAAIRRRRARKLGAAGTCTAEQWRARIAAHGWRCRYCKTELTQDTVTQDHMIPLSRGGSEWPANLVPACASCNCRKSDRSYHDFLEERGAT